MMIAAMFIFAFLLPSMQAAFLPSSLSSNTNKSGKLSFVKQQDYNRCSFSTGRRSARRSQNHNALFYTDDDNDSNDNKGGDNRSNTQKRTKTNENSVRRTSIKGISVSPSGFLVLLHTRSSNDSNNGDYKNIILPIRITSTKKDAYATTSAESLTICQLLSGVDMAGAILSPDVLKNIIGLYCSCPREDEDNENDCIVVEDELGLEMPIQNDDHEIDEDDSNNNLQQQEQREKQKLTKEFVHNFLSTSFDTNTNSFEEANTYQRSRVIFPKISLDSIKIDLPLSSLENEYEHVNENENKGRMINLWKDMVMKEVRKEQKKENQSKSTSIDERYGDDDQVLAPLPLQFLLECRVDGDKTLDIPLYTEVETIQKSISCDGDKDGDVSSSYKHEYEQYLEESRNIMQQVLYSYDDQCSGAFLSLALALRYKCPIVITSRALDAIERVQSTVEEIQTEGNLGTMSVCIQQIVKSGEYDDDDDEDDVGHVDDRMNEEDKAIQSILPQWRSTNALQSQSKRVVENIEQGFQLTKLQGALKIALQRGDDLAAEKIRAEIDKLLGRNE